MTVVAGRGARVCWSAGLIPLPHVKVCGGGWLQLRVIICFVLGVTDCYCCFMGFIFRYRLAVVRPQQCGRTNAAGTIR